MFAKVKEFVQDKKGASLLNLIITVAIALIVMAVLVPVAINEFVSANTTGWNSTWVTVWNIMPIFAFLAFLLAIIALAMKGKRF